MKHPQYSAKKFDPLLVATVCTGCDGCCEGAVREAISLAKACSSKLYAVSVVETNPEFSALAMDYLEEVAANTRKHLDSIKEAAAKQGVNCETFVHRGGDVHRHILDDSEKVGAKLIIAGRKGKTGIERLMMGSVAEQLIGEAPCNVLVVPREAGMSLKKILVATDGSKRAEKAVDEAIVFAKQSGSSLSAICVGRRESDAEAARRNLQYVKDAAGKEGLEVETLTAQGPPYKGIVDTAIEKGVDLIVVGRRGQTGIKSFFMGSTSERVIGLSACAVLVVH